ncbi:MAG: thioredoxin [Candidatus Omnitrophota bacterium]
MGTNTMEINSANFEEKVLRSGRPVVIDLWAEWCMPCKMIAPAIDEIAAAYKDKVDVGKINVDESPELATDLSVMNIPTVIFFKDGNEAGRIVGVNTKEYIEKKMQEYFG